MLSEPKGRSGRFGKTDKPESDSMGAGGKENGMRT
jgi:hypothetical protein